MGTTTSAAAVAGACTAALAVRHHTRTPSPPRLQPGWHCGDLPGVTATVKALRKAASSRRPSVTARGAIFFLPPRDDWAVDFGPKPWKEDRRYRARAPSVLLVLNWSSMAPTFVGGGVGRKELDAPHTALNREVAEELGDAAAAALQFRAEHYQFTHVRQTGPAAHSLHVAHHYAVVVRDPSVYRALLRGFFDFDRPALLHEVHGAVSLPLCIEAPSDLTRVKPHGHNIIGVPSHIARSLTIVRTPLLLHLVRLGLVDNRLLDHIMSLAERVESSRPFRKAKFWEEAGLEGVAATPGFGHVGVPSRMWSASTL